MELELGDRGPHFPSPLRTPADVEKLAVPDPVERTGFVAEAIRKTRAALHDAVPVIGFAGAPFTLAAYMVEGGGSKSFVLIKRLLFEQPAVAHTLFDRLTAHPHPVPRDAGGGRRAHRADLRQLGWRAEPARLRDLQPSVPDPDGEGAPGEGRPGHRLRHRDVHPPAAVAQDGRGRPRLRLAHRDRSGPRPRRPGRGAPGQPRSAGALPPARGGRAAGGRHPPARRPVGHIFNLGHGILPPTSPDAAKHLVETVHRLGCHVTAPPTP